jgi:hypothetical protein
LVINIEGLIENDLKMIISYGVFLLSIVFLCVFIFFRRHYLITYKIIYAYMVSLSCSSLGYLVIFNRHRSIFISIPLVYTFFLATLGMVLANRKLKKATVYP